MANTQNLKKLSTSKAREIGSKGGKASVEARRQRKNMRDQLEMLMKLPVQNPTIKADIQKLGINPDEIDYQMAITTAVFKRALSGDTKAYELIRDTLGEKPIEQIQTIEAPKIVLERPKKE